MKISSRLKRIIIFLGCILRVIVSGASSKKPTEISRIIVVPTGKLGDVVCATPVLRALRQYLPKAHIIVAGNTVLHRPLLSDSGLVDEYLSLDEPGSIRRIKICNADAALITGPSYQSTALLFLAGVPFVVAASVVGGFSPSETRLYRILKRFIVTFPYHIGEYAPRERLRVLEPIGIFSEDTKKHLGFSVEANKKINQFFIDNKIDAEKDFVVGISPTAGNKIKEWPVERFAQVADYLYEKCHAKVIIVGSKNDSTKAQEMVDCLNEKTAIINATGAFDLNELKAVVSQLKLFISVDTGPIYIAEAFNVPTIDIVGPVDERVQPPRGLIHRNVVPPNRTHAELSILNARTYDVEEAVRQVKSISVEAVIKEIELLIKNIQVTAI